MNGTVYDDRCIRMADSDTVVTAIDDIEAGETLTIDGTEITVSEAVPFGHKIAVERLELGEEVRKYGEVIGSATEPIDAGDWVHTHNCDSNRGRADSDTDTGGTGDRGEAA